MHLKLVLLLFICCLLCKGQSLDSIPAASTNRYFKLNYDNDFFSAFDRYYTQGIYLELIIPAFRKSPLNYILIGGKKSQKFYGLGARQDCFTPKTIRYDTLNYLERPYAGTIVMFENKTSLNSVNRSKIYSEITLGAIGPCAKCEEEQKGIHKALDNIAPLGWENQISNDAIINYTTQFEKGIFNLGFLECYGGIGFRAGTLYTDANAELNFRLGKMNSYFDNLGVVKNATKNKFQVYGIGRISSKLVGYNGTLQGGLFTKSKHTFNESFIQRDVHRLFYGIVVAYNRFSVEYSKIHLTKEFKGGIPHGWGHCNFTYCF
jgi:lipid A 3-O-deacylase